MYFQVRMQPILIQSSEKKVSPVVSLGLVGDR